MPPPEPRGDMRRRAFITLLGGAATACPLAARAQQTERDAADRRADRPCRERSGISGAPCGVSAGPRKARMVGGTQHPDRLSLRAASADQTEMLAKELVALQPEVIFAHSTPVTAALHRETRTIPIVFGIVSDPIGLGFVASLARPGGNLTGLRCTRRVSRQVAGYAQGDRAAPGARRVHRQPQDIRLTITICGRPKPSAPSLGIELMPSPVETAADIERAIESFARVPNGGLVLPPDATTVVHRDLIVALAARHRLPAVYRAPALRRGRRSHVLRHRLGRPVSAVGVLCRPHPARRQACRPSGAGADQVRNGPQSQNREGAWPDRAAGLLVAADEVIE